MVLKTGINLSDGLIEFITNSKELFIFVPYVKQEPLKELLSKTENCKALVVRWETKDLILCVSDI
jgi:hypothetical protein